MHTATIEQNRQREREYTREREYYRFEEATDVAERMGYPNDHTLEHPIRHGKVCDAKDVRIVDYTENGLRVAEEFLSGPDLFEVDIRRVENKNTHLVEALARGELAGNAMIEYGPLPDDVREAKPGITIKGYRTDLGRDMVRIHWIENGKAYCRIFTLDNASAATREKVGDFLGIAMPAGRPSIEALDNPHLTSLNATQVDELVKMTKYIHDQTLSQEKGGQWHAGSKFIDKQDALSLVFKHSDLLDEHMKKWSEVVGIATSKVQINELMEEQRKNTPAAIVKRERGEKVSSTNDSSVAREVEDGNYDPYCPTTKSPSSTMNAMGMNQGKVKTISKHCPICGAANITTIISGDIIRGEECGCEREICGTKVTRGTKLQARMAAAQAFEPTSPNREKKMSDQQKAVLMYGEGVKVRAELIVGGEKKAIYNQQGDLLGYL